MIIGTLLVFSINIQANIVEAVVMGVVEVAMPFVIDGTLKSEHERKADTAQAQGQWNKFTIFLGFTDKEKAYKDGEFQPIRQVKVLEFKEIKVETYLTEEADWGEE